MAAFAYMLKCTDGSFYVGSTRATLERRIAEHNAGTFDGYTTLRRPVVLVWSQEFEAITDAIATERQIKGWSRAKNAALISGDFAVIRQLAKRRTRRSAPLDSQHSPFSQDEQH